MSNDDSVRRRDFLRQGALWLGTLAGSSVLAAERCRVTPAQQEGPYYPEHDLDRDTDLVQRFDGGPEADGQKVRIYGVVQDEACKPIAEALVEVWQACLTGRYDHSADESPLVLDPDFQYWGRTRTDREGRFYFRTIIPGIYPAEPGRFRPPHIHYKVVARGYPELITQMYFDPAGIEDRQLAADARKWNAFERVPAALTVPFEKLPELPERVGTFPITLRR